MDVTGHRVDDSRETRYTVDVSKDELNWLYAYDNLQDTVHCVYRENLGVFAEEAFGYDNAQASAVCSALGQACKLIRDGATSLMVCRDIVEVEPRGLGMKTDMGTLGFDDVEAIAFMAKMKRACAIYTGDFTALVHRAGFMSTLDCARMLHLMCWFLDMRARDLVTWLRGGDDPRVETRPRVYKSLLTKEETWDGEGSYQDGVERGYYKKTTDDLTYEQVEKVKESFTTSERPKVVHPDEDCVLPGCDRYGGNDTYLRIRKVLGHKGAFDFCMGNVVKLVDRWDKKGDPVKNLEKLRDYSAQALVEWRLYNEMLS